MTDQQAKDLQQTLDFISGQLHGLAILGRLQADPQVAKSSGIENTVASLIKADASSKSNVAWAEGLKSVTSLIVEKLPN